MKDYILETCVDSVESAMAAAEGGADRLELCSNLIIGGTTPGPWLFEEIRKRSDIRIHALIRPRFGDFCYTDYEWRIMKEEIRMFRDRGADGIVIGMLKPDGILDRDRMEALLEERGGMSVTLHRAFDVCKEPMETLAVAKTMGIQTILTSGQKNTCMEGQNTGRAAAGKPGGNLYSGRRGRHAGRNRITLPPDGNLRLPYVGEREARKRHDIPKQECPYGACEAE
mgnify:CR=1 FL=1